MACCDWETFEDAFLATWRSARHTPGELLIDWRKARTDWKRHHCTGGEAATMQLRELARGGEYLWMAHRNKRNGGDGGVAVERAPVIV
jgi:hypothetical protein